MSLPNPVILRGVPGSPYTRKMLGVLRYRRIPYALRIGGQGERVGLPKPKVDLLPTFYLPDDSGELVAVVDSTPIIRRLEAETPTRSVVPADPVVAFLDLLLEDYADEWLTKAMFHYRWSRAADAAKAARILPRWSKIELPEETAAKLGEVFSERQIGRLGVVGSNATTGPLIEASFERFLAALDQHLQRMPFLLGGRPSACDFAVYGQFTQLVGFDPTPSALALERAPRVVAWVDLLDDLSGWEPSEDGQADQADWIGSDSIPASLTAILGEIGRTYVPVMLANAKALEGGASQVEAEVDGQPWVQDPFPYQRKCVGWIRDAYGALDDEARTRVERILDGTGCDVLVET